MLRAGIDRALAHAGRLLAWTDRRLPWIEDWLGHRWSEDEAEAIADACRASGLRLGHHHAWTLRRRAIASTLARSTPGGLARYIERHDRSAYAPIDTLLHSPQGLLVAMPHHGPYLPAIAALCARIPAGREAFLLLEAPVAGAKGGLHAHAGRLLRVPRATGRCIDILHDDQRGLRRALAALRRGAVGIVMPDAFRAADATYQVPFCGGQRDVMLGTASLARRAGVPVLPAVAMPRDGVFGFASRFGAPLRSPGADGTREGALHADYRLTLALFRSYEPLMRDSLPYWQYCRHHSTGGAFADGLSPQDTVDVAGPLLLDDPRIRLDAGIAIRGDGVGGGLSVA